MYVYVGQLVTSYINLVHWKINEFLPYSSPQKHSILGIALFRGQTWLYVL